MEIGKSSYQEDLKQKNVWLYTAALCLLGIPHGLLFGVIILTVNGASGLNVGSLNGVSGGLNAYVAHTVKESSAVHSL